jgi:hypothetical protein
MQVAPPPEHLPRFLMLSHNPTEAAALQDRLERIQWRLWHGDADEARPHVG